MSEEGVQFSASTQEMAALKVAFAVWILKNSTPDEREDYLSSLKEASFPGLAPLGRDLENLLEELRGMK